MRRPGRVAALRRTAWLMKQPGRGEGNPSTHRRRCCSAKTWCPTKPPRCFHPPTMCCHGIPPASSTDAPSTRNGDRKVPPHKIGRGTLRWLFVMMPPPLSLPIEAAGSSLHGIITLNRAAATLLWLGSTVAIRQDYHSKKSAEKISRFLTESVWTKRVLWLDYKSEQCKV